MEGTTTVVSPPDAFRLDGPASRPVSPSANLDDHGGGGVWGDDDPDDFDPQLRLQDVEQPRPGEQPVRTREDEFETFYCRRTEQRVTRERMPPDGDLLARADWQERHFGEARWHTHAPSQVINPLTGKYNVRPKVTTAVFERMLQREFPTTHRSTSLYVLLSQRVHQDNDMHEYDLQMTNRLLVLARLVSQMGFTGNGRLSLSNREHRDARLLLLQANPSLKSTLEQDHAAPVDPYVAVLNLPYQGIQNLLGMLQSRFGNARAMVAKFDVSPEDVALLGHFWRDDTSDAEARTGTLLPEQKTDCFGRDIPRRLSGPTTRTVNYYDSPEGYHENGLATGRPANAFQFPAPDPKYTSWARHARPIPRRSVTRHVLAQDPGSLGTGIPRDMLVVGRPDIGPGRDPVNDHGIYQDYFVCCGQSLNNEGCLIDVFDARTNKSRAYKIFTHKDARRLYAWIGERMAEDVSPRDLVAPAALMFLASIRRGTAWVDRANYDRWHADILDLAAHLSRPIAQACIGLGQGQDWTRDDILEYVPYVLPSMPDVIKMYTLVATYNGYRCAGASLRALPQSPVEWLQFLVLNVLHMDALTQASGMIRIQSRIEIIGKADPSLTRAQMFTRDVMTRIARMTKEGEDILKEQEKLRDERVKREREEVVYAVAVPPPVPVEPEPAPVPQPSPPTPPLVKVVKTIPPTPSPLSVPSPQKATPAKVVPAPPSPAPQPPVKDVPEPSLPVLPPLEPEPMPQPVPKQPSPKQKTTPVKVVPPPPVKKTPAPVVLVVKQPPPKTKVVVEVTPQEPQVVVVQPGEVPTTPEKEEEESSEFKLTRLPSDFKLPKSSDDESDEFSSDKESERGSTETTPVTRMRPPKPSAPAPSQRKDVLPALELDPEEESLEPVPSLGPVDVLEQIPLEAQRKREEAARRRADALKADDDAKQLDLRTQKKREEASQLETAALNADEDARQIGLSAEEKRLLEDQAAQLRVQSLTADGDAEQLKLQADRKRAEAEGLRTAAMKLDEAAEQIILEARKKKVDDEGAESEHDQQQEKVGPTDTVPSPPSPQSSPQDAVVKLEPLPDDDEPDTSEQAEAQQQREDREREARQAEQRARVKQEEERVKKEQAAEKERKRALDEEQRLAKDRVTKKQLDEQRIKKEEDDKNKERRAQEDADRELRRQERERKLAEAEERARQAEAERQRVLEEETRKRLEAEERANALREELEREKEAWKQQQEKEAEERRQRDEERRLNEEAARRKAEEEEAQERRRREADERRAAELKADEDARQAALEAERKRKEELAKQSVAKPGLVKKEPQTPAKGAPPSATTTLPPPTVQTPPRKQTVAVETPERRVGVAGERNPDVVVEVEPQLGLKGRDLFAEIQPAQAIVNTLTNKALIGEPRMTRAGPIQRIVPYGELKDMQFAALLYFRDMLRVVYKPDAVCLVRGGGVGTTFPIWENGKFNCTMFNEHCMRTLNHIFANDENVLYGDKTRLKLGVGLFFHRTIADMVTSYIAVNDKKNHYRVDTLLGAATKDGEVEYVVSSWSTELRGPGILTMEAKSVNELRKCVEIAGKSLANFISLVLHALAAASYRKSTRPANWKQILGLKTFAPYFIEFEAIVVAHSMVVQKDQSQTDFPGVITLQAILDYVSGGNEANRRFYMIGKDMPNIWDDLTAPEQERLEQMLLVETRPRDNVFEPITTGEQKIAREMAAIADTLQNIEIKQKYVIHGAKEQGKETSPVIDWKEVEVNKRLLGPVTKVYATMLLRLGGDGYIKKFSQEGEHLVEMGRSALAQTRSTDPVTVAIIGQELFEEMVPLAVLKDIGLLVPEYTCTREEGEDEARLCQMSLTVSAGCSKCSLPGYKDVGGRDISEVIELFHRWGILAEMFSLILAGREVDRRLSDAIAVPWNRAARAEYRVPPASIKDDIGAWAEEYGMDEDDGITEEVAPSAAPYSVPPSSGFWSSLKNVFTDDTANDPASIASWGMNEDDVY